ncbi:MAG: hypothetical protein JSW38_03695 [Dehalococcoidia bacterium]|nr:MAG: hypothetical protein JSV02_05910 [Dehalococcoidia bacterium]UCG83932.1 MAG: hypothetical protein JSW38_03695 [Dehalococcoidia bacterium]
MESEDKCKTLGVDIDNVISLSDPAIRRTVWEIFGVHLIQDQVEYYDYHKCGISLEQQERVLEIFRDETCSVLEVVPGAVESLRLLHKEYRIVLVTSRHPDIVDKTRDWLRLKDIPYDVLIFNDAKHRTGHNFDCFIEDNAETALSLAQAGIRTFLYDYPWNRSIEEHPNIRRVYNWQDIVAELI